MVKTSLSSFRSVRWLAVLLVLVLAAGAMVGCGSPKKGGKIIIGVTTEAETLDPHKTLSGSCFSVFRHIYDGLVQIDADASFKPGLAESWTISPDGLTYTFKLRKGVKFTDGTPFDAAAVKFTFDRILDPATAAPSKDMVGTLQACNVIDPSTVEFKFSAAYAPFLHQLGSYYLGIISPTAVAKSGKDYGQNPVGTGPYMLKEWVAGDHITLAPNPNYVNTLPFSTTKKPATAELVFKTIKDEQTMLAALETGEINVCVPPLAEIDRLSKDARFTVTKSAKSTDVWYIEFNLRKAPVNDLKVRQAIGYALKRSDIITAAFQGLGYEYQVPLPNGVFGYDENVGKQYGFSYDVAKAKALLAEAGWVDKNGDGIVEKGGKPFKTLYLTWDNPVAQKMAVIVQAQVKEIGIDVTIQTYDWATFVQEQAKSEWAFEAMDWGWSEPALVSMILGDYKNCGFFDYQQDFPALYDVVQKINQTADPAVRAGYISEALKIELQDAIFVPIGGQTDVTASRAEVKGIISGQFGYFHYVDAYVETK